MFFWPTFSVAEKSSLETRSNTRSPALISPKPYQAEYALQVKNWWMSEKLDGVRAYWDGQALYSRNGNRFAVPDWFTVGFPNFELDGELWTGRGDFERIISIVNQQRPHDGWKEIHFHIFEVPNAPGHFPKRLEKIKNYLKKTPSKVIKVIPQYICRDENHLNQFFAEVEKQGGEGVVVRDPQLPYHTGRSGTSLKLKQTQTAICKVKGYKPGKGKYLGLVGAILCRNEFGKAISVGSGLTDQERENPPAIGKMIRYRYNGLTQKGMPRFPVFLKVLE